MEIRAIIKSLTPRFFRAPAPSITDRIGAGINYQPRDDLKAFHDGFRPIFSVGYDGEKNQGSIGAIKKYFNQLDF